MNPQNEHITLNTLFVSDNKFYQVVKLLKNNRARVVHQYSVFRKTDFPDWVVPAQTPDTRILHYVPYTEAQRRGYVEGVEGKWVSKGAVFYIQ